MREFWVPVRREHIIYTWSKVPITTWQGYETNKLLSSKHIEHFILAHGGGHFDRHWVVRSPRERKPQTFGRLEHRCTSEAVIHPYACITRFLSPFLFHIIVITYHNSAKKKRDGEDLFRRHLQACRSCLRTNKTQRNTLAQRNFSKYTYFSLLLLYPAKEKEAHLSFSTPTGHERHPGRVDGRPRGHTPIHARRPSFASHSRLPSRTSPKRS